MTKTHGRKGAVAEKYAPTDWSGFAVSPDAGGYQRSPDETPAGSAGTVTEGNAFAGADREAGEEAEDPKDEAEEELEEEILSHSDNFDYYSQLKAIPILTQDEVNEYARMMSCGNEAERKYAKEQLVLHNLRYVMKMATGYYLYYPNCGMTFDDMFQEGCFGLIRAVEDFDPNKARLTTYATFWISQKIRRAIMNKGSIIRKPAHVTIDMRILAKARERMENEHETVTIETLANATGMSEDKVRFLMSLKEPLSLDRELTGDSADDYTTLRDLIPDTESKSPEDYAVASERKRMLDLVMDNALTEKEREIIRGRYGLNGDNPKTLEELGADYGVTRERIRQIEKNALRKMKSPKYRRQLAELY